MTKEEFWNLISTVDTTLLDVSREDLAVKPLQAVLTGKTETYLTEFAEMLARALYELDGEEFISQAGESGRSGDGFLYARCYVVAKGRKYYEAVIADPTKMPKSIELWCEPLIYTYKKAWGETTGRDRSEWPYRTSVSYETGSRP